MPAIPIAIFALTYVLIASRRLRWLPIGRPAGALLGAVLMVAAGALTPEQSYAAIDHDTIALLLGMMLITAYLERAGVIEATATVILAACRTGVSLLVALAGVAAVMSAFLVNDTVCLFLTPVVVATCRRGGLPMGPYLVALATSANIGSAATLVGNPQNMLIGSASGLPFARFLAVAAPGALAGLVVNTLLLWWMYRRQLPGRLAAAAEPAVMDRKRAIVAGAVTVAVIAGFFAGLHLGYCALTGVAALLLAERTDPRDVFARVDWTLLLFFASLFVVVAGFASTGVVDAAWDAIAPAMRLDDPAGVATFVALVTVGSNLVSNVPLVMLANPHVPALGGGDAAWVLLAFASTVAGNLTLVGSVANIIVAEGAKDHYTLGFREYLRFGVPSTILVLLVGAPVILWFAG